jgi:alkylhydroperoxidase family enzyme
MLLYQKIMFARGGLTRRQREMLAVVVSSTNSCHY